MAALLISPLYLLFHVYIYMRITAWLAAVLPVFALLPFKIIFGIVFFTAATSMLTALIIPNDNLKRIFKIISNYWLGFMLYAGIIISAANLLRIIILSVQPEKTPGEQLAALQISGLICFISITIITISGIYSASNIKITDYSIDISNKSHSGSSFKLALVSDFHLGYSVNKKMMKQMVSKINALSPDVILIAGDIFDNEFNAIRYHDEIASTLRRLKSRYGCFACYGNHDIEEPILAGFTFGSAEKKAPTAQMEDFLSSCGIRILDEDYVLIDDSLYIYGRPDFERPGTHVNRHSPDRIAKLLNSSKPVIILEHEPRELDELAEAGFDLDLCGHTHDGQLFPCNIITSFFWKNSYGYKKFNNMHSIVTSGVGLFGPNMRLGTRSEICCINVNII